jgi:acyl carrier protein
MPVRTPKKRRAPRHQGARLQTGRLNEAAQPPTIGEYGSPATARFAFAAEFPIGSRRIQHAPPNSSRISPLSSTFDRVADIIAETSEIDRDQITPESHTIDDLGIDSLDFLDIVFAIDKEFGIKIPLEKWTQEVNDGDVPTEEYFVLKNLCAKIDELRAAKTA